MKKIQNNNNMSLGHPKVNLKSRFEGVLKSYLTGWSFTKLASLTKKN